MPPEVVCIILDIRLVLLRMATVNVELSFDFKSKSIF